jgi:Conjugative transposon protein TcpC
MRVLREKLPARGPVTVQTPRDVLAGAGRVALWLAVGLLLLRGAEATLGPDQDAQPRQVVRVAAAAECPDEAARAVAVEFATAYLTHTPGEDPTAVGQRLGAVASPNLAGELAPQFNRGAPEQAVRSATVAHTVSVDREHALVTVAATLATGGRLGTRRLTVPIARDAAGRLVVDDLPSFAAAPARASAELPNDQPLAGADRAPIEDVVTRFLRAYLAGDTGGLAYLVAPGARITAVSGRFELLSMASVLSSGAGDGGRRSVLVMVHARDLGSRALYMLRYRVGLVRRDRWYVAELNHEGAGR